MSGIDYASIIQERARRLVLLRKDPEFLIAAKDVYKENPAKFINDWLVTYNPQYNPSLIPFILFPRQVELINFFYERLKNREDGLCEKCREVGFTWLAVGFAIWLWLFFPDQKISFGSRKESLVDEKGNPDSIFEKIRIALRYLPAEFLPKGFNMNRDALYLKILNHENGSKITGEAGDNIGRGGRSTMVFLDEAAFLERPHIVDAALLSNSDCKIYISTPNGVGNSFWQKRHSGNIPVFTFEWHNDPRKSKEWFEKKKAITDPVIFAREILIDYGASIDNVCIKTEWIKAAIDFEMDGIDEGELVLGLDVADEGGDLNALCYRRGVKIIKPVLAWPEGNTTQNTRKVYHLAKTVDADWLCYDNIGVGAGVKGEITSLEQEVTLPFKVVGINVGINPTKGYYAEKKKNEDMFLNLKAQLWWLLRRRFEKTYEHVNKIRTYPVSELISIPNDNQLIVELSQPRFFYLTNGKIKIESKEEMKKRSIKSPNRADSLILAFAPYRELLKEPNIRII